MIPAVRARAIPSNMRDRGTLCVHLPSEASSLRQLSKNALIAESIIKTKIIPCRHYTFIQDKVALEIKCEVDELFQSCVAQG